MRMDNAGILILKVTLLSTYKVLPMYLYPQHAFLVTVCFWVWICDKLPMLTLTVRLPSFRQRSVSEAEQLDLSCRLQGFSVLSCRAI